MCWLCGAPTGSAHDWEKIEGHSCGKWKDDSTEKDEEFARNSLKRFMHYYDRFKANDDTKKLHPKMIEDVLNKMLIVQNRFAFDADWLRRGLSQLFECRRILSYSYVFAFFMFDDQNKAVQKKIKEVHKNIFEDYQQQLEISTERLSKILEMNIGEYDLKILQHLQNLTVLNDHRCKGLFDIIQNDILGTGYYGFSIANYHPNTEGTCTWILSDVKLNFNDILEEKRKAEALEKARIEEARLEKLRQEAASRKRKEEEEINRVIELSKRHERGSYTFTSEEEQINKAIALSMKESGTTAHHNINNYPDNDDDLLKAIELSKGQFSELDEESMLQQALLLSAIGK